jgi:two-component system cell cycle response regulator DivK
MNHVVVVEDDVHNATLFRKLLEKRGGHRVTVTDDPATLFRLLAEEPVALVIMDVSLGDSILEGKRVNGVDLCRMIKGDPRMIAIPVMLATAHAMRGDAESLLADSGADDYVAKPILDHERFVAQVADMMREAA